MGEASTLLLQLVRYANRENIDMADISPQLIALFRVSEEEAHEIGSTLQKELMEKYKNDEAIVSLLEKMASSNKTQA